MHRWMGALCGTRAALGCAALAFGALVAGAAGELALSLHLNEAAGQESEDTAGGAHHAQLGSSAAADAEDPAWIAGRFGAALRFAGAQRAVVANAAALEPPLVSVEAWVRNSGSPGAFTYLAAKGAQACDRASYALYTGAHGGLLFYAAPGGELLLSPDAGASVWDGAWHHVVGSYDGLHARLYVDGTEVASGTAAASPLVPIQYGLADGADLHIGAFVGSCSLYFAGDIDELKVWSRALSRAEIAARMLGD